MAKRTNWEEVIREHCEEIEQAAEGIYREAIKDGCKASMYITPDGGVYAHYGDSTPAERVKNEYFRFVTWDEEALDIYDLYTRDEVMNIALQHMDEADRNDFYEALEKHNSSEATLFEELYPVEWEDAETEIWNDMARNAWEGKFSDIIDTAYSRIEEIDAYYKMDEELPEPEKKETLSSVKSKVAEKNRTHDSSLDHSRGRD